VKIGVVARVEAHRGLEPVVDHAAAIQRMELGLHAQPDLRVLLKKRAQPRRQPAHGERG